MKGKIRHWAYAVLFALLGFAGALRLDPVLADLTVSTYSTGGGVSLSGVNTWTGATTWNLGNAGYHVAMENTGGATQVFAYSAGTRSASVGYEGVKVGVASYLGLTGTTPDGTADVRLWRNAAGVLRFADDTSASIRGFMGGGANVASATALPVPTGRVFHVTGTTDVTSITSTNFESGACITIIFDGVLNFTDGNNLKLAATMATTADDTISLCYDGTNWFETGRAVN